MQIKNIDHLEYLISFYSKKITKSDYILLKQETIENIYILNTLLKVYESKNNNDLTKIYNLLYEEINYTDIQVVKTIKEILAASEKFITKRPLWRKIVAVVTAILMAYNVVTLKQFNELKEEIENMPVPITPIEKFKNYQVYENDKSLILGFDTKPTKL